MIIVMNRIVKMIPTVTPTNINIWGDKCSEIRIEDFLSNIYINDNILFFWSI